MESFLNKKSAKINVKKKESIKIILFIMCQNWHFSKCTTIENSQKVLSKTTYF